MVLQVIIIKLIKHQILPIKAFVYNLILHWFVAEEMKSTYLNSLLVWIFNPQINKFIENTKRE